MPATIAQLSLSKSIFISFQTSLSSCLVAPSSVVFYMVAHLEVSLRSGQGVVDCGVGKKQEVGLLCLLFTETQRLSKLKSKSKAKLRNMKVKVKLTFKFESVRWIAKLHLSIWPGRPSQPQHWGDQLSEFCSQRQDPNLATSQTWPQQSKKIRFQMEILPAAPLLFCPVVEASAKKAVECVKASSQWMVFLLQGNQ